MIYNSGYTPTTTTYSIDASITDMLVPIPCLAIIVQRRIIIYATLSTWNLISKIGFRFLDI